MRQRLALVNAAIEEFATGLPFDQPISAPVAGNIRQAIDYIFQESHDYDTIIEQLDQAAQSQDVNVKEWAVKTKKTILQRSPTSIRVTLKQLKDGRKWSILETFRKEYAIASRFMRHPDFVEGVSSLLIRKPKTVPQWNPKTVAEVSNADVKSFFQGTGPAFTPLRTGPDSDYDSYPHAWIGLPTEADVQKYMGKNDRKAVIDHFEQSSQHKQGVKEKVTEILDRLGKH